MNQDSFEEILPLLRKQLKAQGVKLWLPPYINENVNLNQDDANISFEELTEKLSSMFGIDKEQCLFALRKLQAFSLQKLKEINDFIQTGIATLNIQPCGFKQKLKLNISLNHYTDQLIELLSLEMQVPHKRWKFICRGKILALGKTLSEQGVKNCSTLLAIRLAEDSETVGVCIDDNCELQEVQRVRDDLDFLRERGTSFCELCLRIEDQNGETLEMPEQEKESLITAMLLHEKGRTAIKESNYSLAIMMLLEADREFSSCSSQLLQYVDNYAVCNLDIAWSYLQLKSLAHLLDAEERLKRCETSFDQSYGSNMKRLLAIKGTTGNEEVLFMRLHLLQGIVQFHRGDYIKAEQILLRAKKELESLKLDDSKVSTLIELGLAPFEARIGLRATYGSIHKALEYIEIRRMKNKEMEMIFEEKKEIEKERRKYGRCLNGTYVNIEEAKHFIRMGNDEIRVIKAMMMANNNTLKARQLLDGSFYSYMEGCPILIKNVEELYQMGYPYWIAYAILKKHNNNLNDAIEELQMTGGDGVDHPLDQVIYISGERCAGSNLVEEAYKRISKGISSEVDDYLDSTLEEEENVLNQYFTMVRNI